MLLKFSVDNYKSFQGKATLDMVPSSRIWALGGHEIRSGEKTALRHAAIYGAYAAGKSNLLDAFALVQKTVQLGHLHQRVSTHYCKLFEDGKSVPSTCDVLFEVDGTYFDYGFSALLGNQFVVEEWLYASSNRSEHDLMLIFSWSGERRFEIGDSFAEQLSEQALEKLREYIEDFTRKDEDALFLSFMNHERQIDESSEFPLLDSSYAFFASSLKSVKPDVPRFQNPDYFEKSELNRIAVLLKKLGVEVSSFAASNMRFDAWSDLHHDFDFSEESDGTKLLFAYVGMLFGQDKNAVYLIDGFGQGLHPLLTRRLVQLFEEHHSEEDDCCQLIFATHESTLLDGGVLRNDGVWFIDRDEHGCSTLTSLDRFRQRCDASIYRNYLSGRYGGIPAFAPLFTREKVPCAAEAGECCVELLESGRYDAFCEELEDAPSERFEEFRSGWKRWE